MNNIRFLYVKNVISRTKKAARQTLAFFVLVETAHYDKCVDILWMGEDGVWHTLAANFHSRLDEHREYWLAEWACQLSGKQALPGNIQFALRLQCQGQEYWDNNHGQNYSSQADTGIRLLKDKPVQNIEFGTRLTERQRSVPIQVAIACALCVRRVVIHWTTDNWVHSRQTICHSKINYWDRKTKSNARNPNHYGFEIWQARIKTGSAFRLQYSICCETDTQTFWDNNYGYNYSLSHDPLKVLILNLHCYQEDEQDYKLAQIAKAIDERNIDIICFQEVAENWNEGQGDWNSNAAKIINDRLQKPMHIHSDWSHIGFERYREGVAILSRYPILKRESRYVSEADSVYDIHSRKVVMAQVRVPFTGKLNVFSVHLSWWEDGFAEQFQRLSLWAERLSGSDICATLLCGDFNVTAGSQGYIRVVDQNQYEDQFLAANAKGLFDQIFRVNDAHWRHLLADDYRIDYIFMNKDARLRVVAASVLFTEHDYGKVSDHCGYVMSFEPR